MKNLIAVISLVFFTFSCGFSQNKVVWLKNNTGIVEDNTGSVILWENQIEAYGDAIQSNSSLGGEQMQETYPGKVNVGFSKEGSYLELENSNGHISDNSFSVFYVGKVGTVNTVASLFGNFDVAGTWGNCSGLRFTHKNGQLALQYGRPNYKHFVLSDMADNTFFFFGFSMDSDGNYTYFDNNSTIIKTGKIDGIIYQNTENIKLNLHDMPDGGHTYDHTEVAEFLIYDASLSATDFKNEFDRLTLDYKELVIGEFSVLDILPSNRTNLLVTDAISLSFSQEVDFSSVLPKVYVNRSETEAAGNWSLTTSNVLTFVPSENWPLSGFVTVQLKEGLTDTQGTEIDLSKRINYNFLVETERDYGTVENIVIDAIATVDYPQEGHKLPLKLTLPSIRTEKIPVHIWVHGGGWSGGTAETSVAGNSPHGDYLAENLGIATLGISYRCHGSSGKFTLAMEDIDIAIQWAKDNAETYNFDMSKVFFSGGSAGAPLAALASQRYDNVIGFIGFNGIYDFVNDQGSFGQWNGYGQENPSAIANSAIFQLRETPAATILMHGDADTTIPYTQSTLFSDAINNNGGNARAVIYPNEVHAFFNLNQPAYEDVLIEMVQFINEVLEEQKASLHIEEKKKDYNLIMYPNPIAEGDALKIQLNKSFNGRKVVIKIVNLLGQTVLESNVYPVTTTFSIPMKNLSKGTYFFQISGNSNRNFFKFLIK